MNKALPRFRLRVAFALITMIALILGWIVDDRRMRSRIVELELKDQIYERQFAELRRRLDKHEFGVQTWYFWASATDFIQALKLMDDRQRFDAMAPSLARANSDVPDESVRQVIGLLDSQEEEVRSRAVQTLIYLQNSEAMKPYVEAAVDELVPRLGDTSSIVVGLTVHALGSFGPASRPALDELRRMMMNDEEWYASHAASAVAAIDPSIDIGPRLIELATAKRANWPQAACFLPKHLPPERARQVLTAFYESMESEGDRNTIIQILNEINRGSDPPDSPPSED
jgi:hypothetical protein